MIKAVNKRTKKLADLDGIVAEWKIDYNVPVEVKFTRSVEGDVYYAVDTRNNETMGEVEICYHCEESWICLAGSIHDEDYCTNCGHSRDGE